MVAMSKSPVRAESHVTEGARVVVLAAAHGPAPPDVRPGGGDLATVAPIKITVEAHVLSRDREILLAVSTDAHAVRRRFGAGKGPACVKTMIRCRPGQIFDAGSPQQPQLLWSRMSLMSLAHLGHSFAESKESGIGFTKLFGTNSTTSPRSFAAATFNLLSPR